MVNVEFDLTWHTAFLAGLFGLTSSVSVIMVDVAEGLGYALGVALFSALLIMALQTAWGALLAAVDGRYTPGVLSRNVFTAAVTVALAYVLVQVYQVGTQPGVVWSGEPTTSAAYAGVLVYGTAALVPLAIGKFVLEKARGDAEPAPA